MLGVVGTCCAVHANERNNSQHCWQLSKEAMHSGTVILTVKTNREADKPKWQIISTFSFGHSLLALFIMTVRSKDCFVDTISVAIEKEVQKRVVNMHMYVNREIKSKCRNLSLHAAIYVASFKYEVF